MDMEALMQGKCSKTVGTKLACLVPGKAGSTFSDELVKALIFVDPRKRFNARDALNHPFLVSEARKRARP
jgi:serine/threonine protein kinase